jgi:phage terminase small subunit
MAKNLTKKEKGFVNDISKTGNGTQAALKNYDTKNENSAASIASQNLRKLKIQKAIADRLPNELLEEVHLDGLKANKIISANIIHGEADEKTNDFIEVPDHPTRHKFLDTAYKVKNLYPTNQQANTNVLVILKFDESLRPSAEDWQLQSKV